MSELAVEKEAQILLMRQEYIDKQCLFGFWAGQWGRYHPNANALSALNKAVKLEFHASINWEKVRRQKELCDDVNNNPCEMDYILVTQKAQAG